MSDAPSSSSKVCATILRDVRWSSPDAVEKVRELLERCESGEVIGVAMVGIMRDGMVTTGFSDDHGASWKMLGGIEYLKKRILDWIEEG